MKTRRLVVIQVRRSVAIIILAFQFGCLAALFGGYVDLRALHDFDARRDYDVCRGTNAQIYRTVDRLVMNAPPDRKQEILDLVRQGETDCEVYKLNP